MSSHQDSQQQVPYLDFDDLNSQQLEDMYMAYRACERGIIPDERYGFYNLSLFALDRISSRFLGPLALLVNNWNTVAFEDIFRELEDLTIHHPVAFRDLVRNYINDDDTSSDEAEADDSSLEENNPDNDEIE